MALLMYPVVVMRSQQIEAASLVFPVVGPATFSNDFDASRSNGKHNAIDIIANKHQPIVSRTDGTVAFVGYPQPSWGYAVFIEADNGNQYWYIHINNDNPGTDDGNGGGYHAYGPDMQVGNRVVKGQLLGYVGDSGNAEETVSHLHFEVYDKNDNHINPYDSLVNNSVHLSKPVAVYPKVEGEILPSGTYRGGGSVAMGDVDGDSVDEIVLGPGPDGAYIKVFEQDGTPVARFAPNGESFKGGADVAVGDVDGDHIDDIITGAGAGGSYVKVFAVNGTEKGRFAPNGESFKGGANVAAGDIDGNGTDEIITGAGPGGAYVKVFNLAGVQQLRFAPYGEKLKAGISVAAGNVAGTLADEIITGARKGAGPRISIFDAAGTQLKSYYAYDASFKGGIRVEAANVATSSAFDEVLTVPQTGGSPRVKMFAANGGFLDYSDYFAEEWWRGYYDFGASDTAISASLGTDRRTSLRPVEGL